MTWKNRLPDRSPCEKRGNRRGAVHDWKLLKETYYWEYWSCEDCPAIRKRRPKGW